MQFSDDYLYGRSRLPRKGPMLYHDTPMERARPKLLIGMPISLLRALWSKLAAAGARHLCCGLQDESSPRLRIWAYSHTIRPIKMADSQSRLNSGSKSLEHSRTTTRRSPEALLVAPGSRVVPRGSVPSKRHTHLSTPSSTNRRPYRRDYCMQEEIFGHSKR